MTDFATLRLVVEGNDAQRNIEQFGRAAEQASQKAEKLEDAAHDAGNAMSEAGRETLKGAREAAEAMRNMERAAQALGTFMGTALALAAVSWITNMIEESREARREMERLAEEAEKTMRRLVNAGDVARMQKMAEDAYLGTPAEQFKDGIVEQQKLVDQLRSQQESVFGALGSMFSGDADRLREAQEELDRRIAKFEDIRRRILDTQNVPFLRYGADPITTFASPLDPVPGGRGFTPGGRTTFAGGLPSGPIGAPGYDPDAIRRMADANAARAAQQQAIDAQRFAETFYEQLQIAGGRFFSDFFQQGVRSLPAFWDSFKQLAFDALGQLASKALMDSVGSRLPGAFGGGLGGTVMAGTVFGVGASIVDHFLNAGRAARELAMAMEESARNIEQYARFATDMGLTSEQRQLRDLLDQRDALARQAVAATGASGFTGGIDEARQFAETMLELTGAGRWRTLIDQLNALQDAYEGNIEAVKANVAAMQAQAEAERRAAYDRQIAGLQAFRDSLNLSGQSILSPTAQLAEARRQYETILALAQAGDQSAVASLPETARAFLDASRRVNASGTRYAADFNRVQSDTQAVIAALETMRDETPVWVGEFLDRVDPYFTEQIDIATSSLSVQQEGFSQVVAELVNVRAELNQLRSDFRLTVAIADDPVLY